MAHARQQIRQALAGLLTGLGITGARVYTSRNIVLQDNELPALEINTNAEQIASIDIHSNSLERTLTIDVLVKVKALDDVDNTLDDIITQIETRINLNQSNRTLSGLCQGLDLTSIEIGIDETQASPVGQALLRFETLYYTAAQNPEIIL